ncbi:MAG TPA: hypothetical protein VMF56_10920 [Acidobacteriaceae bacterium]|nr:hypothetical protein [Acidobacteriaceae bacterium]
MMSPERGAGNNSRPSNDSREEQWQEPRDLREQHRGPIYRMALAEFEPQAAVEVVHARDPAVAAAVKNGTPIGKSESCWY